jgi:hypothetical protein
MRRSLVGVVLVTAILGGVLGGLALASHQFPDVATGSAFHDDINDFVDAGCATGFPDGTYHPQEAVKRQQMARFVHACAGRVQHRQGASGVLTTSATNFFNMDLTPGALGDGGGFGWLTVSVYPESSTGAGLPCEVRVNVVGVSGEEIFIDVGPLTTDPTEHATGTLTAVVPVPSGSPTILPIQGNLTTACAGANITARARASFVYFPFDGLGNGGG